MRYENRSGKRFFARTFPINHSPLVATTYSMSNVYFFWGKIMSLSHFSFFEYVKCIFFFLCEWTKVSIENVQCKNNMYLKRKTKVQLFLHKQVFSQANDERDRTRKKKKKDNTGNVYNYFTLYITD